MVGIESQEGQSLLCGALGCPCLQSGGDAGRNTARHSRTRQPSREDAPAVTRRHTSRHALIQTPAVERFPAPCLSGVRAGATVKQGDSRCLRVFAGIRRRSPERAQCPTAPRLGTLGGMIHDTRNTRQVRRARTLPTWEGRARSCPSLPNTGQRSPARPGALPVLGRARDTLARAARHDGCPRYAGRPDVDSTRSAACPLGPPNALGSPHRFERGGSSGLTAWRRASWTQARSVRHSAAASLSPMQGQHEAQAHQRVQEGYQP
jgi:hypothetical protein